MKRLFPVIFTIFAYILLPSTPGPLAAGGGLNDIRQPLDKLEPNYRDSVIRGWKLFQTSFAADGMACVNCHLDHEAMAGWSGGYPKVEVFDGTPYEVKTLRAVVLETLSKHTDLSSVRQESMADDITAYIAWWGGGRPVRPGLSRQTDPAAIDIEKLQITVSAGRSLFFSGGSTGCFSCHLHKNAPGISAKLSLESKFAGFPKYVPSLGRVVTLDTFLSGHASERSGISDHEKVTALAAYLAYLARDKTMLPGSATSVESEDGKGTGQR